MVVFLVLGYAIRRRAADQSARLGKTRCAPLLASAIEEIAIAVNTLGLVYGEPLRMSLRLRCSPEVYRRRNQPPALPLNRHKSAINEQLDSSDKAAVVGCKEHDGFGQLVGQAHAAKRNACSEVSLQLLLLLTVIPH